MDVVQLVDLPEEILVLIFLNLNLSTACSILSTCKRINNIFETSPQLAYGVQCQWSQTLDNRQASHALSDRLIALRKHERAWRRLDMPCTTVNTPRPHGPCFDCTSGVYLLGRADGIPTPLHHQGTSRALWYLSIAQHIREGQHVSRELTDAPIPDEDATREWRSLNIGEVVVDFGVNISEHDLISVVTTQEVATSSARPWNLCLHFIHASSGTPHSQARVPIMHVCESYRDARHKVVVGIVGGMLVLLVNFGFEDIQDVIYIIAWKSGHIAMELRFDNRKYTSFVFLSTHVLALLRPKPFSFDLAHLPADWNVLQDSLQPRTGPVVTRTLLLPELKSDARITHFSARGEPNPSVYGARYGRDRDRPFTWDPSAAIVVSRIWVRDRQSNQRSPMAFVVHRSSLLSLMDLAPTEANGMRHSAENIATGDAWTIPWNAWGPEATHWFRTSDQIAVWLNVSCGTRFVLAENFDDINRVVTYDFGKSRLRKAAAAVRRYSKDADVLDKEGAPSGNDTSASSNLQWILDWEDRVVRRGTSRMTWTGPSELTVGDIELPEKEQSFFAEKVVSRLPYILVSRRVWGNTYQGFLMEDECLIGLKGSADDDLTAMDIFMVR